MKYAVIKLGGKQFKVSEGDIFELERQNELNMDVLMYSDEDDTLIGEPTLENVDVKAEILENKLGKKVNVSRFRAKSRHRRKKGHRQPMSVVEIQKITKKGKK